MKKKRSLKETISLIHSREFEYWIWDFSYFLRYYAQSLSLAQLFVTIWIVTLQAPLSMGFSRQEYWNGFHFLSRGSS